MLKKLSSVLSLYLSVTENFIFPLIKFICFWTIATSSLSILDEWKTFASWLTGTFVLKTFHEVVDSKNPYRTNTINTRHNQLCWRCKSHNFYFATSSIQYKDSVHINRLIVFLFPNANPNDNLRCIFILQLRMNNWTYLSSERCCQLTRASERWRAHYS